MVENLPSACKIKYEIAVCLLIWLIALVVIFTGMRPFENINSELSETWVPLYVLENSWDWARGDHNNASFVLGALTPFLSRILNTSPSEVFRNVFPFIYAITPVLIYLLFRRVISPRRAFLASLFFIVLPPSYQEIPNTAKSMIAEPFAVASLLLVTSNSIKARLGTGLTALACVVSHYTVGIMLLVWLGLVAIVKRRKLQIIIFTITFALAFLYLSFAGGGVILKTLKGWHNLPDHQNDVITEALKGSEFQTYSLGNGYIGEKPATIQKILHLEKPLALPFKIPFQVMTIIIWLNAFILFLGGIYWITHKELLVRHKGLSIIIAFSAVSVILAMYVPFFTKGLYISRWIQLAGIPMSGLYGVSTYWISSKYSYPLVYLSLLLLLLLVR